MSVKFQPVSQSDHVDSEMATLRGPAAEFKDELDAATSTPLAAVLLRWCGRHPLWFALGVVLYTAVVVAVVMALMGDSGAMPSLPTSAQQTTEVKAAQPAQPAPAESELPKPDAPPPESAEQTRLRTLLQELPEQFYNRTVEERAEILMSVEYPSRLLRHPLTLVMAYYRFAGAKHSVDQYTDWLGRFLGVSDQPMLVATSPDLFTFLAGVRYARCTNDEQRKGWTHEMVRQIEAEVPPSCPPTRWLLDYASPFAIPPMVPLGPELAVNGPQHRLDPERHIHAPFLYAVWSTKAWLLNYTAHANPFSSNYFAYLDAGFCREDSCRYPTTIDPARLVDVFERDDSADRPHLRRDEGKRLGAETVAAEEWGEQRRRALVQRDAARTAGVAEEDQGGFVPQWLSQCAYLGKAASPAENGSSAAEAEAAAVASECRRSSRAQAYPSVWHPHPSSHPAGVGPTSRRRHMLLFESMDRAEADPQQVCPMPLERLLVPAGSSQPAPSRNNHFAGTFFVGSGPAARWFAALFQSTLRTYNRLGWFWGKDQDVFNTIVTAFPHSFLQLESFALEGKCGNMWFFLPQYFQPEGPTRLPTCDKFGERMVTRVADRCVLP